MPELPEVETIRRDLRKMVLNKTIISVDFGKNNVIKGDKNEFLKKVVINKFVDIQRFGKFLVFILSEKKDYILIHLRMTGQLIYNKKEAFGGGGHPTPYLNMKELPNKFTHVTFIFLDGSKLFFNDIRRFGFLTLVNHDKLEKIKDKYGLEPFSQDYNWKNFQSILEKKKKTKIKQFLLDQSLIAGIGNIYADEVCFAAGVLPNRTAGSLSLIETKKIYQNIPKVLQTAIKNRGTSFSDYVDAKGKSGSHMNFLNVYGREKEKCKKCKKGVVKKNRMNGRGTCFCEVCQK